MLMAELTTLQKSLLVIKKLKQQIRESSQQAYRPIAITGMSCRFPQASTLNEYWDLLLQGKSVISHYPEQRWDLLKNTSEMHARQENHIYWGGYLDHLFDFDAYFFGISPREAIRMDPQQRILLEVAYEAFEDAGISVEELAGSNTGVFTSLYSSQIAHLQECDAEMDALYLPTGNASSIAANRLSYLLDLHGPSLVMDTACSSSLVAVHTAILNLQNNLCDQALVCGININFLPSIHYVLSQAKMLSRSGQCNTFSADADGYVQGEGAGAIILKPLDQAIKDKDRIYAVIAGSGMNQDGKTNGLTAPNGLQQERLLQDVYQIAHVDPKEVAYVECHGTGTFLGDPIEIQALGHIVGRNRDALSPCLIGSVKTNLGHLEPAAGMASIIKVALSLHKNQIPKHLNFHSPNPHIQFDKFHFQVPQDIHSYPENKPKIAGISGFGFGGTNAHIVMREMVYAENNECIESDSKEIFTLSAKNMHALYAYMDKWIAFLSSNKKMNLAQVCHHLHLRRSHYGYRLAMITQSIPDLLHTLKRVKENVTSLPKNVFLSSDMKHNAVSSLDTVTMMNDLSLLASAYVSGAPIDWRRVEEDRHFYAMSLPLYPWQHKEYNPVFKSATNKPGSVNKQDYPLQGRRIHSPLTTIQFAFQLDNKSLPDLKDTFNVLHAGYYIEMLAYVVQSIQGEVKFSIYDHSFLSPLFVLGDSIITVHINIDPLETNQYAYTIHSSNHENDRWILHAKGHFSFNNTDKDIPVLDEILAIKTRLPVNELGEKLYEQVLAMGMPAGDSIRWTHQYWRGENEILSEFKQPLSTQNQNDIYAIKIHPGIFDAAIQPVFKLLTTDTNKPYIASHVKEVHLLGMQPGPYYLYGILNHDAVGQSEMICHCYLMNTDNKIIAIFKEVTLTQLDNKYDMESITNEHKNEIKLDLSGLTPIEYKKRVLQFLSEQIANIFSMPVADIDVHASLLDMGMDSLMALVFMRTLEAGLGVSYSLQELLQGPSLYQLLESIMQKKGYPNEVTDVHSMPVMNNHWIAYREPQQQARMRLFCFPYGGGGASLYRHWQQELPDTIEVCPVQMPGREGRMNEAPVSEMSALINALIEHLQPEFNLPFAFFGHSFGALIAYELAITLRERQLPQPMHLFVSAFPDPRIPSKSLNALLLQLQKSDIDLFAVPAPHIAEHLSTEKLHLLSSILNDHGISQYGDHLKNAEVSKALLPIFCGDMGIVKSYQFNDAKPLEFNITVFAGKHDTWVAYDDHLSWCDHTSHQCDIHTLDSGHLFIKDEPFRREVIHQVKKALNFN